METNESLRAERDELADKVIMSYSPDDFPGSPLWYVTQDAIKALDAFDTAHPDIIAAIKAERKAKAKKRQSDMLSRNDGWYD